MRSHIAFPENLPYAGNTPDFSARLIREMKSLCQGAHIMPLGWDKYVPDVIDAAGLVVMAGGVDVHSHIVGSKVNAGRKFCPEDHYDHDCEQTKEKGRPCDRSPPETCPGLGFYLLSILSIPQASPYSPLHPCQKPFLNYHRE